MCLALRELEFALFLLKMYMYVVQRASETTTIAQALLFLIMIDDCFRGLDP